VKVTAVGWQVILCDPIWQVICHSGVVICYDQFALLTFTFMQMITCNCWTC